MRPLLHLLCIALCSETAIAQGFISNFDACVASALQHPDGNVHKTNNYSSYKCDGESARPLFQRPDECAGDKAPTPDNTIQQDRNVLTIQRSWDTGVCGGRCDQQIYSDGKTSFSCEVRKYINRAPTPNGDQPDLNLERRVKALEIKVNRVQEDLHRVLERLQSISGDIGHRRRVNQTHPRYYDYCPW